LLISVNVLAETDPKTYTAVFTVNPPLIDGDIDCDSAWSAALWTDFFVDIEGEAACWPIPFFSTRVKMLWDNNYIYFAARLKEPHIWATITTRDQLIYYDNDFEIFLDPTCQAENYFEIEINPLNTILDLFLNKPYRHGGNADIAWNCEGLLHAVKIVGSLNNSTDIDTEWTVEIAVPFSALNTQVDNDTEWRINFSRVEWDTEVVDGEYVKCRNAEGRPLPEHNWVWSPQGVINMHIPEKWGILKFTKFAYLK
jgi:hypothetical protein